MNARRIVVSTALALGAVVLATPAGASTHATKNGCKLLKTGEVAKAIGRSVKKAEKPAGPPQTRVCGYEVTDGGIAAVNLWVDTSSSAKREYAAFREVFGDDSVPVASLGKKAFFTGGTDTIYVLKSGDLVYLQYVDFNLDDTVTQPAVEAMTKIVLKRI